MPPAFTISIAVDPRCKFCLQLFINSDTLHRLLNFQTLLNESRLVYMSTRIDIPIGASASETITVTRELTVAHVIPNMPEVYGTPFMIYLMEHAAAKTIEPFLSPGWASVGLQINIRHMAATPVGFLVTATATVLSLSKHLVTFSVKAHDGVDLIGEGVHERAIVELARFNAKVHAKKTAE